MQSENLGAERAGAARIGIGSAALQDARRSCEAQALPDGGGRGELDTGNPRLADLDAAIAVNRGKAVGQDAARIIAVAGHPPIVVRVAVIIGSAPSGRRVLVAGTAPPKTMGIVIRLLSLAEVPAIGGGICSGAGGIPLAPRGHAVVTMILLVPINPPTGGGIRLVARAAPVGGREGAEDRGEIGDNRHTGRAGDRHRRIIGKTEVCNQVFAGCQGEGHGAVAADDGISFRVIGVWRRDLHGISPGRQFGKAVRAVGKR